MVVHLTGMGLLGSLTAWQLYLRGIDFTWDDNDSTVNAWAACTGACYPSVSPVDQLCYQIWRGWANQDIYPEDTVETCAYWVDGVTKSLPHGLDSRVLDTAGPLRLAGKSVHLNSQELVHRTRTEFTDTRLKEPHRNTDLHLVSHGFTHRLARYIWGWTRLVKLDYSDTVAAHGRPSFYLRKNRFQFAYCYPQPSTDWWYAGSSLVSQRKPKRLDSGHRYTKWKGWFYELTEGEVEITEEGRMLQGWRPATAGSLSKTTGVKGSEEEVGMELRLEEQEGKIYYPTMSSNGFRHFPYVWEQVERLLHEKGAI